MNKGRQNMVFKQVLCGGTFDRLHEGHKAFLRFAFSKGQKVRIGITSDVFIKIYKKHSAITPFPERKKSVVAFLKKEGFLQRANIVALTHPFDATQLTEDESTALLVSSETYAQGQKINQERKSKGIHPLPLIVFPILFAEDGEKISSTNIRKGIITRKGTLRHKVFSQTLFIQSNVRELLHKPFGTLFSEDIPHEYLQKPEKIATVGDVITKRLHALGILQKLSVIDFFIERKKTEETLAEIGYRGDEVVMRVQNHAGQLNKNVWDILRRVAGELHQHNNFITIVDGEEDLLVIPLIILLPVGFLIFYGQPHAGAVVVEVTKELKEHMLDILQAIRTDNTPGY